MREKKMFRRRRIKEEEDVSLARVSRAEACASSRSKTNLSSRLSLSHIHISSRIVYFVGDLAPIFGRFIFQKSRTKRRKNFQKI